MTIEELNKLIKEELNAFLEAEDDDADAGDDIEVTTDEPAVEDGDEALDTLRQVFNMLKPLVEPEEEVEDIEDEETEDDEIADGEDDEEGLDENVGSYGASADPANLLYFLLGSVGLGAFAFLSLSKEDKKEIIGNVKAKAADIKALMKLTGTELKSKAQALAGEIGLGGNNDDSVEEAVDNHTFFRGDNANRVRPEAKDVQGRREKVNESVEKTTEEAPNTISDRFQKLANIQK